MCVFTWRHGGHICVPKQWNGGHVCVPNQSCGSWTLLLCKRFLLFQICIDAVGHVSENTELVALPVWSNSKHNGLLMSWLLNSTSILKIQYFNENYLLILSAYKEDVLTQSNQTLHATWWYFALRDLLMLMCHHWLLKTNKQTTKIVILF